MQKGIPVSNQMFHFPAETFSSKFLTNQLFLKTRYTKKKGIILVLSFTFTYEDRVQLIHNNMFPSLSLNASALNYGTFILKRYKSKVS